jgi:hypothetical protein
MAMRRIRMDMRDEGVTMIGIGTGGETSTDRYGDVETAMTYDSYNIAFDESTNSVPVFYSIPDSIYTSSQVGELQSQQAISIVAGHCIFHNHPMAHRSSSERILAMASFCAGGTHCHHDQATTLGAVIVSVQPYPLGRICPPNRPGDVQP